MRAARRPCTPAAALADNVFFFTIHSPWLVALNLVFEAAEGALNLAFNLVDFSFGFELGIARRLANHVLD